MSDTRKMTHLLDWLSDGWTHCQHGSREWCEEYLANARTYIDALEAENTRLKMALKIAIGDEDRMNNFLDALDALSALAQKEPGHD